MDFGLGVVLSSNWNWCRVGSTSGFQFRSVVFPRDSATSYDRQQKFSVYHVAGPVMMSEIMDYDTGNMMDRFIGCLWLYMWIVCVPCVM